MDNKRREFLSEPFNIIRKIFSAEEGKNPEFPSDTDAFTVGNVSDSGSMYSDFTEDDLRQEIMRLGIEPVNMQKNDMLTLIAKKLKDSREDLEDKRDSDLDLQNRKN